MIAIHTRKLSCCEEHVQEKEKKKIKACSAQLSTVTLSAFGLFEY